MSAHKYLEKPGVYKGAEIIINSPERACASGEASEFDLSLILNNTYEQVAPMSATSKHSWTIVDQLRSGTHEFQCSGEGMSRSDWVQPSTVKDQQALHSSGGA